MADKEDEQRRNTMLDGGNEDATHREKMLGGDNVLWTIECLRGRLLAERAASKTAKRDAELLGKKLIELEKKLKQEIKLKNKAEKKLKYLIGKLEALKLSRISVSSDSVNNEDDSTSSTATSGLTEEEEENSEIGEQEVQRKTDAETDGIEKQSYGNDEESSTEVSDNIDSPCKEFINSDVILRQTPARKTASNGCRKNSHSLSSLFSGENVESEDQRNTDSKTRNMVTLGSIINQSIEDNEEEEEETSGEVSDEVDNSSKELEKGDFILTRTPTNGSRKISNSLSSLFSAGV